MEESDAEIYENMIRFENVIDDVFTEEGYPAVFKCTVMDTPDSTHFWRKDGMPVSKNCSAIVNTIALDGDMRCTRKKTSHILIIQKATEADQGIYSFTCQNTFDHQTIKANLYVSYPHSAEGVIYNNITYYSDYFDILKHLRNVNVREGQTIELSVCFRGIGSSSISWYKNQKHLKDNRKWIIKSHTNDTTVIATLVILKSEVKDSGIYYVVCRTRKGVLSSSADVFVTYKNENEKPIIEEMPFEIGAYENEGFKIISKVTLPPDTKIEWHKDNSLLFTNVDIVMKDYGREYVGLKIISASNLDWGTYKLSLTYKDVTVSATTEVSVTSLRKVNVPRVMLQRPLLSAVATVGSKLTFDCCFDIRSFKDSSFFYVVWYVGRYKIERTNSKFSVIFNGGEYLLHIKKLEIDMAGEVVCELRKCFPDKHSVRIGSSTSRLSIVPFAIVEKEKLEPHSKPGKMILNERPRTCFCFDYSAADVKVKRCSTDKDKLGIDEELLYISFCRLGKHRLYFLNASKGETDVEVCCQNIKHTSSLIISWNGLFKKKCWFAVGIAQSDGSYTEVSNSSVPYIEIQRPVLNILLRLSVRAINLTSENWETKIMLDTPTKIVVSPVKNPELQPLMLFNDSYTETGDILGNGSFGTVTLAKDNAGKHYAVKMIPTATKKESEKAIREFQAMKQAQHVKVIGLIEAFHDRISTVIVMEYLWGGELFDRVLVEDHITEEDVVNYVRQICEALSFLHNQNMAHLDIKPENIICLSPNTCDIKIIDFGIAMVLDGDSKRAIYGTRHYISPEILNYEAITTACDMWAVGVVTYVLLSGVYPFASETFQEMTTLILKAKYNYDDEVFTGISTKAKDFINSLLILKPKNRLSAKEALRHPWIKNGPKEEIKTKYDVKRTQLNMRKYLTYYRGKWQKVGHMMIAARRFMAGQRHTSNPESNIKLEPCTESVLPTDE